LPSLDPNQWRALRDGALFVSGLLLAIHEAFFTSLDRPGLLALAAVMMGLGIKLRNGGYPKDDE
jgi:hypothetical protein